MRSRIPLTALLLTSAALVLHASEPRGAEYNVERKANIPYYDGKDADPARQSLILHVPLGKKDFPVLVFVHGGAWSAGNNSQFDAFAGTLAARGVGVVLVNHRFGPPHVHPAQ